MIQLQTKKMILDLFNIGSIQFANDKDGLGQTHQTPDSAIKAGSDIIIVGRGIYQAENPKQEANEYRRTGWSSYVLSLSS